ncbi:MAG: 2-C-methyl-D-erythritol 4-phosphate cytidylyltransferase [Vampirovibrionales bacterium]|nr:2-C-methyl-D-erythritol 4-phosphate cytidylyltransferase [Vampirovibrionales bacterium]
MGTAWAIVPAAGSGQRFSQTQDKLAASLGGVPVLVRTIQALLSASELAGVVIAVSDANRLQYQALIQAADFSASKIIWTRGGESRCASVYAALKAVPDGCGFVVIHDAARPLLNPGWIGQGLALLRQGAQGVVVALPVYDTIKRCSSDGMIEATMDRTLLWRAQTPQMFHRPALMEAYEKTGFGHSDKNDSSIAVTDDAQLLELVGLGPLKILSGSVCNLKITTLEDIRLAESFLSQL